ncbi:MAG: hypothetical protein ABIH41_04995 [Nanoarchaeota archaeon]
MGLASDLEIARLQSLLRQAKKKLAYFDELRTIKVGDDDFLSVLIDGVDALLVGSPSVDQVDTVAGLLSFVDRHADVIDDKARWSGLVEVVAEARRYLSDLKILLLED